MDYRIKERKGVFSVYRRTVEITGFWIWKKEVEAYQLAYDIFKRPHLLQHNQLYFPPLPPFRNLQDAIVAVYHLQPKCGCSWVKTEVDGDTIYYYYQKNEEPCSVF